MPPKTRKGQEGKHSGSDDDGDGHGDRSSKHRFTAKLTSKEDYLNWKTKLLDLGFANGPKCNQIITQGFEGKVADDPDTTADDWDTVVRRDVWFAITNGCAPNVRAKHNRVTRGNCEAFIRSIKDEYDHQSETSLEMDRLKLSSTKLVHHEDLPALFCYLEELYTRVGKHSTAENVEKVSDSMQKHYLYAALPSEFATSVEALRLPHITYTWDQVKNFCWTSASEQRTARARRKAKAKAMGKFSSQTT
jgi:hypothetical protein